MQGFIGSQPSAEVVHRTHGVDALRCPRCAARTRVMATLVEPATVKKRAPFVGTKCIARRWDGSTARVIGTVATRGPPPAPRDHGRRLCSGVGRGVVIVPSASWP